jgi:hypothetical protein
MTAINTRRLDGTEKHFLTWMMYERGRFSGPSGDEERRLRQFTNAP